MWLKPWSAKVWRRSFDTARVTIRGPLATTTSSRRKTAPRRRQLVCTARRNLRSSGLLTYLAYALRRLFYIFLVVSSRIENKHVNRSVHPMMCYHIDDASPGRAKGKTVPAVSTASWQGRGARRVRRQWVASSALYPEGDLSDNLLALRLVFCINPIRSNLFYCMCCRVIIYKLLIYFKGH